MDGAMIMTLSFFALALVGLIGYGIANRPKILTGPATVESHSVEVAKFGGKWSHGWNYLIHFRLSDGDILELYTTEAEYQTIKDGQTGTLFWDDNQLMDFIPDPPQ